MTAAEVLGVHYETAARWVRAARRPRGVDAKPPPAPAPGPTGADPHRLGGRLAKGAKAHGRHDELWAAARAARPVERHFRPKSHPEHAREVLERRLGWAGRKPGREARERNDEGVARWAGDEFPRVVRGAWRRSAHVAFLDGSGLFPAPTVRRAPAPRGRRPVPDARDRRDRWGAVSRVTASPAAGRPGRYSDPHGHDIRGPGVVAFLAELHRRVGRVTVAWDRDRVRGRARAVKAWPAEDPGVAVEDFPGYVPGLNPDAGVWGRTECGRPANPAATDEDESWDRVADELIEVEFRPDRPRGFVRQTGLPGVTLAA